MLGCDFKQGTDDSNGTTAIKITLSFDCAGPARSAFFLIFVSSPLYSHIISLHALKEYHLISPFLSTLISTKNISPNSITSLTHLHYCTGPVAFHLTPYGSDAITPNSSS